MAPEEEMEMHQRVKAHWATLGQAERAARYRKMKEADDAQAEALKWMLHWARMSKINFNEPMAKSEAGRWKLRHAEACRASEEAAKAYFGE